MRTRWALIATLLAAGPVLAASNNSNYGIVNGYDYMAGTDVYHRNYDYGLHYDRLTSLPDTDANHHGIPGEKNSRNTAPQVKLHPGHGQAAAGDRFPNMDAELKHFQTRNLTGTNTMSAGPSPQSPLESQGDQSGKVGLPDPYSDLNLESDLHQDLNKLNNP